MTVTLPADLQAFVDEQVNHGEAPDANAVVTEAVRVLQQKKDEEKLAWLRAALAEGEADIAAGRVSDLDASAILAEVRAVRAGRAKP
ncbi:MAG: type II toxin-antitoxin system ParD family antitoxin [Gemmataceae bacterium]